MRRCPVSLELYTIFEIIEYRAIDIKPDQPASKTRASIGTVFIGVLVRADNVPPKLGQTLETGLFIAVFGLFRILSERAETEEKSRSY